MRKENSTNTINEKALQQYCNAFKTLSLITGRWKLSILFKLLKTTASYSDFKHLLPQVSDRTLSKQLNDLVRDGLILKNKTKISSIYTLTAKGQKLEKILVDLSEFQVQD
ncbi:helix-turn-helix domain-containing protein [Sphingobacterium sp. HMA12]|uniref:winged helix-turn-helix transcriptional regulator n=1 Tax=Sphingobacterium sp. HMA12 TaxID=2050894 RepID=UPI000CE9E2A1|nr:helix-turn-helix domain-containing protein [Sphingobacterium sp. HMA12]